MPDAGDHPSRLTRPTSADLVIVGAGLGALRTAEAARRAGFSGSILVIGRESHPPYNRPPLSKTALISELTSADLAFPLRSAVDDVEWMLSTAIDRADLAQARVTTSGDQSIHYDHLVIATGRTPRRLPSSVAPDRRHVVYTIEDAQRLRRSTSAGERVAIIGGGFIGCEVAASLRARGCAVTLVCSGDVPLERTLGRRLAEALVDRHRLEGVVIESRSRVLELVDRVDGVAMSLEDGRTLVVDAVVEALGSVPAADWLADGDVVVEAGVATDPWLRARKASGGVWSNVHVVGDVAQVPHPLSDQASIVLPHWSTPVDTARVVGAAVAASARGERVSALPAFSALPTFWTDQYDLHMLSYGMPATADNHELIAGSYGSECVVGYSRQGRLIGVVGVGMRSSVMALRDRIGQAI